MKNQVLRRRRRVTNVAAIPSASSIEPAPLLPLVSQQPPLSAPSQHTPPPAPSSMQPNPSGQFFASRSHGITQVDIVPSLAHAPEMHSVLLVHVAPTPPGASGPAMHAPSKQM